MRYQYGTFILPQLQALTTTVVIWSLDILSIPFLVESSRIQIPSGIIEIAYGCSGLNYLMSGVVLGVACSELLFQSKYKLVTVLIAFSLSILVNWIRVISIVLIAYYSKMQHPLIDDHGPYGWYLFAAVLFIFFIIAFRFQKKISPITSPPPIVKTYGGDRKHSYKKIRVIAIVMTALFFVAIYVFVFI